MNKHTIVHVTTLSQWKSVLNVWFAQGYDWAHPGDNSQQHHIEYFNGGQRFIALNKHNKILQGFFHKSDAIEYSEFMDR